MPPDFTRCVSFHAAAHRKGYATPGCFTAACFQPESSGAGTACCQAVAHAYSTQLRAVCKLEARRFPPAPSVARPHPTARTLRKPKLASGGVKGVRHGCRSPLLPCRCMGPNLPFDGPAAATTGRRSRLFRARATRPGDSAQPPGDHCGTSRNGHTSPAKRLHLPTFFSIVKPSLNKHYRPMAGGAVGRLSPPRLPVRSFHCMGTSS